MFSTLGPPANHPQLQLPPPQWWPIEGLCQPSLLHLPLVSFSSPPPPCPSCSHCSQPVTCFLYPQHFISLPRRTSACPQLPQSIQPHSSVLLASFGTGSIPPPPKDKSEPFPYFCSPWCLCLPHMKALIKIILLVHAPSQLMAPKKWEQRPYLCIFRNKIV